MTLTKLDKVPKYKEIITKEQEEKIIAIINNLEKVEHDFSNNNINPKSRIRYYEIITPAYMFIKVPGVNKSVKIMNFAVSEDNKIIMATYDQRNVYHFEIA